MVLSGTSDLAQSTDSMQKGLRMLGCLNLRGLNAKRCEHANSCRDLIQIEIAQVGMFRAWMHVGESQKRGVVGTSCI